MFCKDTTMSWMLNSEWYGNVIHRPKGPTWLTLNSGLQCIKQLELSLSPLTRMLHVHVHIHAVHLRTTSRIFFVSTYTLRCSRALIHPPPSPPKKNTIYHFNFWISMIIIYLCYFVFFVVCELPLVSIFIFLCYVSGQIIKTFLT